MTKEDQFVKMRIILDELQWRMYLGTEALQLGRGGISLISKQAHSGRKTIARGIEELEKADTFTRIRNKGGGRKALTHETTLDADLEKILEPKGDPMSLLLWTTKSLNKLSKALKEKGHIIKRTAIANLLHTKGFSLKSNKKNIEGISHPDRDEQFKHIKNSCDSFEKSKCPIISVDCKKKELIGNFKNNGREWSPKGENTVVNVYDFKNLSDGKACPYGVYDIVHNKGFVNVGTDHDTASFAVESIRKWWNTLGKKLYPNKKKLLITSDGGGSNGVRNRLWKKELQMLSNETGLSITVNHLPPATSKWNKIEHRLFGIISINWRSTPLTSLETIIELISHTTTKEGLTVSAVIDNNIYPIGVKVTDEEMNALRITRDVFHGEWNYTIKPQN